MTPTSNFSGNTKWERNFGVSKLVIGITVVAIGTSLPELVASVAAACRKASDLAIGNVIGSNIMNLLLILGASTAIQPIEIAPSVAFNVYTIYTLM